MEVPVANLIGEENSGFKYIMHNFNHERWGFVVQANRFARVCYEEAFKYAHRRRTFGKPLIEHPVIRAKLADMVGRRKDRGIGREGGRKGETGEVKRAREREKEGCGLRVAGLGFRAEGLGFRV